MSAGLPAASLLRPSELPWRELGAGGGVSRVCRVVTSEHSDTLGSGLCLFERCSFPWRLTYDECVHVLEGEMEVEVEGESLRAGVGDVVFLRAGSEVTYRFAERCRLFYATYPVNWDELLEVDGG